MTQKTDESYPIPPGSRVQVGYQKGIVLTLDEARAFNDERMGDKLSPSYFLPGQESSWVWVHFENGLTNGYAKGTVAVIELPHPNAIPMIKDVATESFQDQLARVHRRGL